MFVNDFTKNSWTFFNETRVWMFLILQGYDIPEVIYQ